jgi:hypothetical protein
LSLNHLCDVFDESLNQICAPVGERPTGALVCGGAHWTRHQDERRCVGQARNKKAALLARLTGQKLDEAAVLASGV